MASISAEAILDDYREPDRTAVRSEMGAECFHINLHSCPIWDVARQFGQACASEFEFIRDVIPEARVERVAYKAIGAHTWMYEIHT